MEFPIRKRDGVFAGASDARGLTFLELRRLFRRDGFLSSVVLPLCLQTQGEAGAVVPGTHKGAPEEHNLKRKAIITTLAAAVIWGIVATIIVTGAISVRDFDWFNRMPPLE